MRKFSWFAIFIVLLFAGCVTAKVSPDAVELGVEFTWQNTKNCSSKSPMIKVASIPPGTKMFKVVLSDLDVPTWNHGGGKVQHDGSGVIPAGALKNGYNGPCPPSGTHRYQFTVKAVDAEGVVIGVGKTVRKFPI